MVMVELRVMDGTEDSKNDVIEESEGDEQIGASLICGTDRESYWYGQMIKGMVGQGVWDDKEEKVFACIMVCQYSLALMMKDEVSAYDGIEYLSMYAMSEAFPKAEGPKCEVVGHKKKEKKLGKFSIFCPRKILIFNRYSLLRFRFVGVAK